MNIGIIGIGLIGSSLARAFRLHKLGDILIHDFKREHLEEARRLELGTRYFDDAQKLAAEADIIFVCVPVGNIVDVVRGICPRLKKGTIITDVGSVKSSITRQIREFLPRDSFFVPGHPISGSEFSGPAAGQADLFANRPYVLIDGEGYKAATAKIANIAAKIGANVLYLDADCHDQILAFTSHLPHICAFAAMAGSEQASQLAQQDVMSYAGPSFRDLTRVAAASVDMWKDIFLYNRQHVLEVYKLFRQEMDRLVSFIERAETGEIERYIAHARELRCFYYDNRGELSAKKSEKN
jgi:cyclohexadieny/prephenate dehydrogenase